MVQLESVVSALDMHEAVLAALDLGCDLFIAAAAVADFRPVHSEDKKIKKVVSDFLE